MKCIDINPASWGDKVNYVDTNNRVLGFDMGRNCCEDFGHGVFSAIPADDSASPCEASIDDYAFADEDPTPCLPGYDGGGGGLAFRIVAHGKPDLWVCIWNHHNGYYSHGFTWAGKEDYL